MKRSEINFVCLLALLCHSFTVHAQVNASMHVENIPFIDRDQDGINDVLQYAWGKQFLAQYKAFRKKQKQLIAKEENNNDHNAKQSEDGSKDTLKYLLQYNKNDQFNKHALNRMLLGFLRRHYRFLDQDGDGRLDREAMRRMLEYELDIRKWLDGVRRNVRQGLPPYPDENLDGIPDNLPSWVWRGYQQNGQP